MLGDHRARARSNTPVPSWQIAKSQGIPASFLTQILLKLKGAGLVRSIRGSFGGYRLARPPEQIMLREVLQIIDGNGSCQRDLRGPAAQVLAEVWDQVQSSEIRILSQTSIAQLAERLAPHEWII
jgi:Rrf2 family protein